jgi:homoserine kinase
MAHASAPASSANLGPAFDAMAVAVELRCRVDATLAGGWSVEHLGSDAPAAGSEDAVLIAARCAVGSDRPLALKVDNEIPLGRGLGSSSAAFAAGALAAWKAVGEQHPIERLFELVTELEGHPDNAAAAVYGGLVLAAGPVVHRLPWNPMLRLVVAVPSLPFATKEARSVLPSAYPMEVVVRTIARTASLVAGLMTGDGEVLRSASGDELHEAPRGQIRPDSAGLISAALSAGAYHACWSGAGPSVLALCPAESVESVAQAMDRQLAGDGYVLKPEVATTGAV